MERLKKIKFEDIVKKAKVYMPELDDSRLRAAYEFASKAHEGKERFKGFPYVNHPMQSTYLMMDLRPDEPAILASLLHDTPLHMKDAYKAIREQFGDEVYGLVKGASKLGMVKVRDYENQVELFRKLFLTMAKDLRVVFIRLSDRLHNMLMLEYRDPEYQQQMAQETMDVYAPIASRLGVYQFKGRLEDLAFKHLDPQQYEYLTDEVRKYSEERQVAIDKAVSDLKKFLKSQGYDAEVSGRVKHIYSIHNKLKRKNSNDLTSIYDVFALRVVVSDQQKDGSHLYSVLGAIHGKWPPLGHRFKDYIAVPKSNGYRSLHTSVVGLIENRTKPVEIQIRTESMHHEAEFGISSHWLYKEDANVSKKVSQDEFERTLVQHRVFAKLNGIIDRDPELRKKVERLIKDWSLMDKNEISKIEVELARNGFDSDDMLVLKKSRSKGGLMMRHKYFQDQIEWLEGLSKVRSNNDDLKLDIFKDRIFVLTPHGDVKDLPQGATPVDFAYAVHTDVGHTCYQAKVDGQIVPLDYELKNGQVIDILTRKEPKPNRYWLSFVKTSSAANKIKSWFRSFDRDHNLKEGRDILNKYLRRIGKPVLDPQLSVLKSMGGKRAREDIIESIGNGTLTVGQVLRKLFPEDELAGEKRVTHQKASEVSDRKNDSEFVLVSGHDDLSVVLSSCCKPKFGDPIVGYVTRGKDIRVHRPDCEALKGLDQNRIVDVEWKNTKSKHFYQATLTIEANDRSGFLNDITSVVAGCGCNIAGISFERNGAGGVFGKLDVEVGGYDDLEKVMDRLEGVFGVTKVGRG